MDVKLDQALIKVEPDSLTMMAGMPLLLRQALSLQKGGIGSILVQSSEKEQSGVETILSDERVDRKVTKLTIEDQSQKSGCLDGALLVIKGPVVIDPLFVSSLRQSVQSGRLAVPFALGPGVEVRDPSNRDHGPEIDLGCEEVEGTCVLLPSRKKVYRAKRDLLLACRKPMAVDGMVCFLLGRRLSAWISYLLIALPMSPNAVTGLSLVVGLLGAAAAGFGGYHLSLLGAALLFLSWVLDNCDGEIARVKHLSSTWGAWFDIYADFITNLAFVAGMAAGAFRQFQSPLYLYIGAYTLFAMVFYNAVVFRFIHRLEIPDEFAFTWWFDVKKPKNHESREATEDDQRSFSGRLKAILSSFFSVVKYLGRRDFFIFAYLVAAAFGFLHLALWATCFGATFSFILTIIHIVATRRSVQDA